MDIQGWLETTADGAPPNVSSDHHHHHHQARGEERPAEIPRRRYRRKRQGASIDSSLIAPQDHRHLHATAPFPGVSTNRGHATGRSGNLRSNVLSRSSSSSDRVHQAGPDEAGAQSYERRPRRKMKADRYDPKRKKHKKERDVRHESKAKRRKSNLTRDGSRATGLLQSFQLKTGLKNNRLTLKPDYNAGLFKHGRASAPAIGKGTGLPDLVFNEMKFLEKPDEHQDHLPGVEVPQHSKKHDRKRARDEHISTYFSASRKAQRQGDEADDERFRGIRTEEISQNDSGLARTKRRGPASIVELPEKPFLGFGSKAVQPERKESRLETGTYLTWSETAPRPSPPAHSGTLGHTMQLPLGSGQEAAARLTSASRRRTDHRKQCNAGNSSRRNNASALERSSRNAGSHWQRLRSAGQTVVKVYQPQENRRRGQQLVSTSPIRTTLEPLPRGPIHQHNSGQLNKRSGGHSSDQHDEYRTSDILKIDDRAQQRALSIAHGKDRAEVLQHDDKENDDPASSFSLDRVLLQVREAVSRSSVNAHGSFEPPISEPRRLVIPARIQVPDAPIQNTRQQRRGVAQAMPSPNRPQASLGQRMSSGDVERIRRQPSPMEVVSTNKIPQRGLKPPYEKFLDLHQPPLSLNDDQMLDTGQDYGPVLFETNTVYATEQQVHDLVHRSMSIPRSVIFEAQAGREPQEASLHWLSSERVHSERLASHTALKGSDWFDGEVAKLQERAVDDGIVGFWKPHKLY